MTDFVAELRRHLDRTVELEAEIDRLQVDLDNQRVVNARLDKQLQQVREKCRILEGATDEDVLGPVDEEALWGLAKEIQIRMTNKFGGERRVIVTPYGLGPVRWKDRKQEGLGLVKALREAVRRGARAGA